MNNDKLLKAVFGGMTTDAVLKQIKADIPQNTSIQGEATVRLKFTLTKGKDSEAANTSAILSQQVLAKALVNSGVVAESFKEHLRRAAIEALTAGEKIGNKLSEADERILKVMEEVQAEVVAQIPKQKRSGRVTVYSDTEIISANINSEG